MKFNLFPVSSCVYTGRTCHGKSVELRDTNWIRPSETMENQFFLHPNIASTKIPIGFMISHLNILAPKPTFAHAQITHPDHIIYLSPEDDIYTDRFQLEVSEFRISRKSYIALRRDLNISKDMQDLSWAHVGFSPFCPGISQPGPT
jgi:hypothetical protein